MIRRAAENSFLLVTQVDHARVSGQLAESLGRTPFDRPEPRGPVLTAIGRHDDGWPLHDDEPTLNPQGLPLDVFELPMVLATKIWGESARRVAEQDPYAGLLVSLHQLNLSALAQNPGGSPNERARNPRDLFALNKFDHAQIELQTTLRAKVGLRTDLPLRLGLARPGTDAEEDRLRRNFRWLVAMDRLSLQLCCGRPLFKEVEEVYLRGGGGGGDGGGVGEAVSLAIHNEGPDALRVGPWPFEADELRFEVLARRVSAEPFLSDAAFRESYAGGAREVIALTLRPM